MIAFDLLPWVQRHFMRGFLFRLSLKKLPEAFSGGFGLRSKKAPHHTGEKSSGTKGNYLRFLIQKRDRS